MATRDRTGERYTAEVFFQELESVPQLPEIKLLIAVLQRAIFDYTDPKSSDHLKWNASRWLFSRSRAVMSPWWICSHLSDDPGLHERLLDAVKNMREKPKAVLFRVDSR